VKVELLEDGTLRVTAETPMESFALSHWYRLWEEHKAAFMVSTVERTGFNPRLHPEYAIVEAAAVKGPVK
jgi:hypothetical protein